MKAAVISIILAVLFIGGVIVFSRGGSKTETTAGADNISLIDGKQVVEIEARGGYRPRSTIAKADMPTEIKIKTKDTFDCSSALTIPSLNYRANLPPSGETIVEVPPQKAGATLQGLCAMGMYSFSVKFN